MGKVYYNQTDSRWRNHPYPAYPGYEDKTVGTSGCGPTCAAMVISSSKEIIYPDEMCDISRKNGYRVPGGTSDGLFDFVAKKWGLDSKRLSSSYEAHKYCKKGWFVIICCGSGLWSTDGHYILAVGADGNDIEIYDPYLYSGKFDRPGRKGKVTLKGNSAWVNIDTFKANSNAQRFFAFDLSKYQDKDPDDPVEEIMYVNTKSLALNVRKGPGTDYDIVGTLPRGTQVLVHETKKGWARIGSSKWVTLDYLSKSKPVNEKTMYVDTNALNLNVRKSPGGKVFTSIPKGTKVIVVAEENGWSQINSPVEGWVSSSYLSATKPSSVNRHTVGETRKFKSATTIFSKSDLSGTQYDYKANTTVKILENVSKYVDKIYVNATGRVGYVNINVYK